MAAAGFSAIDPELLKAVTGNRRASGSPEEKRAFLDQQAEMSRQQGYQEGFELGKQEGFEAGYELSLARARQELEVSHGAELARIADQFAADLQAVLDRIGPAMERFYESAENQMTEKATEVVERILRHELRSHPESVLGIVRAALEELGKAKKARVRLNPFDMPGVLSHREELQRAIHGIESIELVTDPNLEGGCVVESESGVIDASVSTIVQLLEDAA